MNTFTSIREVPKKVKVFFTHDVSEDVKFVEQRGTTVTYQIMTDNFILKHIIKRVWNDFAKKIGATIRISDNKIKLICKDEFDADFLRQYGF